jgi:hypothetical protein
MTRQRNRENPGALPAFSKRAARRIIQRACVLTGRDRHVRQHLRHAGFSSLWVLEDWNFTWTVVFDRGRIKFDRRPTKKPDVTFIWQRAATFFARIEGTVWAEPTCHAEGDPALLRLCEPVCQTFAKTLGALLRQPVDENGMPLV